MEKKILSSAIASVVAMAVTNPADAGKNDRPSPPLDNPLADVECFFDESEDGGFMAHWVDLNNNEPIDGGSKYGGDLKMGAWIGFSCVFEEPFEDGNTDGMTEIELEFGLSQNAEDAFSYICNEADIDGDVACWASIDWEDIGEAGFDAAAEAFGDGAECVITEESEDGTVVIADGTFSLHLTTHHGEGGSAFSVKEMNPGKGRGRQNWVQAGAVCEDDTPPPEPE